MSAATRPTATRSRNVTAAVLGLWLVLLCALGAGDAGAQPSGGTIRVLASWTGAEATAFRRVLDAFTEEHHIRVEYQGTTALREVLLSEVRSGTPPDIAVLPSSGELAAYAAHGYLAELDGVIPADYPPLWTPRLPENGPVYGIAVKADLKSIVWYDGTRHTSGDLPALAADSRQWCVGMGDGATSGWPGTDWVEDILLRQQGKDVYEQWATGDLAWDDPRVAEAWRTWGELLSGPAAQTALRTDFRAAGKQLFAQRPSCALEHQGSFIRGGYSPHSRQARFGFSADVLRLPGSPPGAYEVSGDFAALFKNTGHTGQARELMRYLAAAEGQQVWAEKTPRGSTRPFSANSKVPVTVQSDDVARSIARTLKSSSLCLDASDAMPPRMRLAFQRAVLTFLSYSDADKEKRLGTLLGSLEKVHRSTEHSTLRGEAQPWPSTVCG